MAVRSRASFSGFEAYKLTGITVLDQELGHGSYATVLTLDYLGLKCAGKKIHEALLRQGNASYSVRRFEEECHLLSQVRHPNIVQFLGVHFPKGEKTPILVMELLPMNLTFCIDQHNISQEISYSILHDVALGLCYLHNHMPVIIHRDLSSNNVLLDSNLKAKISDLGVARILNLTPLQVSRMTQTPGTPAYMPPEVMVANPKYDKSIDVFSYGILMIHILSGRWPEPQVGPSMIVAGKLIPVTEAERRNTFIQIIGNDHPLMALILTCINNDPQLRVDISVIVQQLRKTTSQYPVLYSNRLEMLRHIEALKEEKNLLEKEGQDKDDVIRHSEAEIAKLKEVTQMEEVHKIQEMKQQKLIHMTDVEQLQLQVSDLLVEKDLQLSINSGIWKEIEQKDTIISVRDKTISMKDSEIDAMKRALEEKGSIISATSEHLTRVRDYLVDDKQVLQASITWNQCADLPSGLAEGQSVMINNQIFCGGTAATSDQEYLVYCYDSLKDKWSSLPPLPVRYCGLGQVNGELVAIGGMKKRADVPTSEIYIYDASLQRWKETFTSMPTSRAFPSVLSLESLLVVVGGLIEVYDDEYTSVVEILKTDISQWYRADALPTACHFLSMIVDRDVCYAIADCDDSETKNIVFYSSVDSLVHNATLVEQTGASCNTQSAWKILPSSPSYQPVAATLDSHLLVIGGWTTRKMEARKKEVYVYSSSLDSWTYISDLPAPRTSSTVVTLSRTEILVIGGYGGDDSKVSSVYKGTLNMKI